MVEYKQNYETEQTRSNSLEITLRENQAKIQRNTLNLEENEVLKDQIAELSKAFKGNQLVKEKVSKASALDSHQEKLEPKKGKKAAKDPNAPASAMTAYRYYCEANPSVDGKSTGDAMRLKWKECQGEERNTYVSMATVDKKRFQEENAIHMGNVAKVEAEEKALENYYGKQKQDLALEFFDAHMQAQKVLDTGCKGKKKNKKDPEAPKGALSSYFYFVQQNRADFVKQNPSASVTELSKILGEAWGKLNKGKGGKKGTKDYEEMAEIDRIRYAEQKKVYEASKTERDIKLQEEREHKLSEDKEEALKMQKEEDEKIQMMLSSASEQSALEEASAPTEKKPKKVKKTGPKKACSAYIFFTSKNRTTNKATMPETTTNQELFSEIGRQWKSLTDEQKIPYNQQAAEDKLRYNKEMVAISM